MKNKIISSYKTIGKLILVVMVAFCFAVVQANAAEKSVVKDDSKKGKISKAAGKKSKINLPDGLYMYDSWISHIKDESVRFEKFFVVQNDNIYSSREAIKKFGVLKLNELFTENKKYKILLGGEKIGEIQNLKVDDEDGHKVYEEKLFSKNIKQGPAYKVESVYIGRLGSAAKFIAVPEEYKETQTKIYKEISQEEVDKVSMLAKEKLYPLVKNKICKILHEDRLELLDKLTDHNGELYIGVYRFVFKRTHGDKWIYCNNQIIFSIKNQNVNFVTSRQDADWMTIYGMLDVDGDGEVELITERTFTSEDWSETILEIYKQKVDGNWTQVKKIRTKREL